MRSRKVTDFVAQVGAAMERRLHERREELPEFEALDLGGRQHAPDIGQGGELRLPTRMCRHIVAHVKEQSPLSGGGLLFGWEGLVSAAIPCRNAIADIDWPLPEYLPDPREAMEASERFESAGRSLIAVYHSHPQYVPYPSLADRARVRFGDAIQVVISLRGASPELHAYRLSGGAVREIAILTV